MASAANATPPAGRVHIVRIIQKTPGAPPALRDMPVGC
jgi:hypothetical protein